MYTWVLTLLSTVKGKHHQANLATLYTVGPAMENIKPRIITVENTSGLKNMNEHRNHFEELIKTMVNAGPRYNVRYTVVNMADYGLPQERKRLLIVGARYESQILDSSNLIWC